MLTEGKPRILVVDDEQDLCEILRFNFEAEGFEVCTAGSGEEALALLSQGLMCELILLDVMMERMSGLDVARQLRSRGDATPIIFLTALSERATELEGFSVGADDFIAKPFSFDSVLARVRAVLRRSAGAAPDEPNALTRREQMLYRLLVDHQGCYLSRTDIMRAVWPGDAVVGERTVDVHIARLRKKLGAAGSRIVNKAGIGYGWV